MGNAWSSLSMADKTKYIQDMVRQGISTLDEISAQYNAFAEGGANNETPPTIPPSWSVDQTSYEGTRLEPWKALNNIYYEAYPDTSFTRENTGVGSIEAYPKGSYIGENYPGTEWLSFSPNPAVNALRYDPASNDAQDIRLDALHFMPDDPTYDVLRQELINEAKYYEDIQEAAGRQYNDWTAKTKDPKNLMPYEQFINNEVDGLLRNMFIQGTDQYIQGKHYWRNPEDYKEWYPGLMPYVDRIHDYLRTGKRPANILPEVSITRAKGGPLGNVYDGEGDEPNTLDNDDIIYGGRAKVEGQPVEFSVTAPYTQPYTYYSPWDQQWYGIGYGGAQVPVDNPGKYSLSLDDYMRLKQDRAKSDDVGGWHQLGDQIEDLGWILATAPMSEAKGVNLLTKAGRDALKFDLGIANAANKSRHLGRILANELDDAVRWSDLSNTLKGSTSVVRSHNNTNRAMFAESDNVLKNVFNTEANTIDSQLANAASSSTPYTYSQLRHYLENGIIPENLPEDIKHLFSNFDADYYIGLKGEGIRGQARQIMDSQVRPRLQEAIKRKFQIPSGEASPWGDFFSTQKMNEYDKALDNLRIVVPNDIWWDALNKIDGYKTTKAFYSPKTKSVYLRQFPTIDDVIHETRHRLQHVDDLQNVPTVSDEAFNAAWSDKLLEEKAPSIAELRNSALREKAGFERSANELSIPEQNELIDQLQKSELKDLLRKQNSYTKRYMKENDEIEKISKELFGEEPLEGEDYLEYLNSLSPEELQEEIKRDPLYKIKEAMKHGWGLLPFISAPYIGNNNQKALGGNLYAPGGGLYNFYEGQPTGSAQQGQQLLLQLANMYMEKKKRDSEAAQQSETQVNLEPIQEQQYDFPLTQTFAMPDLNFEEAPETPESPEVSKDRYAQFINYLDQVEGFKENAYRLAGEDYPTIGFGFYQYYPGTKKAIRMGDHITREEALKYMPAAIQARVDTLKKKMGSEWNTLTPNQQDALLDISYNAGEGASHFNYNSRLRQAIHKKDWEAAAKELDTHSKNYNLANRNTARRKLWSNADYSGGRQSNNKAAKAREEALKILNASRPVVAPVRIEDYQDSLKITRPPQTDYVKQILGI